MIVLDSSFLIGFHNQKDAHHESARVLMDTFLSGAWGKGLLLEYVFLEVMTVLLLRCDLAVATRVGQILLEAEELEFVPCSDFFAETMKRFTSQDGTSLSFVDSAIAVVAGKRAGGLLLTFDEEFKKIPGLHFAGSIHSKGQVQTQ